MVLIKVIDMNIRNILGRHCSVGQCIPVEFLEPGVRLQLTGALLVADPVRRFSLKTFIDEVGGCN